jgi:GntR family transcriptional regulator
MVDHITLDKKRFKNLTRADFDKREGSIYQLYQMRYGQSVVKTNERLRAGLAGKQISAWLKLKPEISCVAHSKSGSGYSRRTH